MQLREKAEWPVNLQAAGTQVLQLPELTASQLQASVLRLDKIHPVISGNKWFKLKYHLQQAQLSNQSTIVTFGGAYSNHIIATACMCRQQALYPVGIIRGEKPAVLSVTLQHAARYGMELLFVGRNEYAQKEKSTAIQALLGKYSHPYIIPEGGAGEKGIQGCREIAQLVNMDLYSHIMCCIGTGTMFTGLLQSVSAQRMVGIPVLKLDANAPLLQLLQEHTATRPTDIFTRYHCGGYAKKTPELIKFMNRFYSQTGIPTDFVYTGKLMAAFINLVETGYFPRHSNILVVHSGGLQGNASLPAGTLVF